MRKFFPFCLFITVLLYSDKGFAQKLIGPESPYGYTTDSNLPDWAKEMYKPNPNIFTVKNLYEGYYKTHQFKKNKHTQYYKRWSKVAQKMTDESGIVQYPNRQQTDLINNSYLQLLSTARMSGSGAGSSWTCIGPFDFDKDANGRSHAPGSSHVYTVEKSKNDPNFLVAGTANAGVYKTTDKGLHWIPLTEQLLIGECRAVEIQFDNNDVIYAGGNGRIYKTTDGGANWNETGGTSFNNVYHNVYSIVMVPGNSQKLFATTNYGLYRTTNGGNSWIQVVSCPGSGEYFGDIEIHPTDTSVVYAIYNSKLVGNSNKITEFYKSTNGGDTFTALTSWPSNATTITGSNHQNRAEIAVTPAQPDRIYAILTGKANGGEGLYGFYRSDDAGTTWTHHCCGTGPGGYAAVDNTNVMGYATDGTDDGGQYYYDLAIDADKTNANKVHVGGIMQWVSTDGGNNFTCLNSWADPGGSKYVHADIHDIRIYGNEVWVACDGGIFLSENSGNLDFNRRQFGIAGTDFWGFGAGFKDGNIMLGGTYHNSHLLKNNNVYLNGWISYTGSADGFRGFVNPGYNKWVYHDFGKDKVPNNRTSPFIGYPFEKVPNASYYSGYSCPLVWDPRCYTTVYSGVDGTLWKSEDDGISWTSLKNFGTGKVTDLEVAFDNPQKIYVVYSPSSGARIIYKSLDGGINWTNISIPNSVLPVNTTSQIDITIDVHSSDNIWAGIITGNASSNGYKIFKSDNGGASWNNLTTPMLDNQTIQSVVFQRGTQGGVYLGTNKTVFYRNTQMNDWVLYSTNLPALTSCLSLVPWYKGGKIRNASNRSVWEASLYEMGAPKAQITVDKLSSGCARDTFYFSDYSSQYQSGATWNWQITPTPAYHTPFNQEQVKVVFGNTGSFQVKLVVSDSLGTDSISYNNFITVSNSCDYDTIPGNALDLSAQGQFASGTESLYLNSNTVTFSAWIKPNGAQPNWAGLLFFRGGSTTCGINFRDNGSQLGYHWNDYYWDWTGGPDVNDNEWNHIALVVTPNAAKLYLNGVSYDNNSSHPTEAFDTPLRVGNDPASSARTFNGLIDEVCIYNRALSQNEIRELMHLTKKPQADTTLVTYLQFNENNGLAFDKVGINHVSLAGGAARTTSTAPVGGGVSARLDINTAGNFTFGNTGLNLGFANGSLPMGEVCVSRINQFPDVIPSHPDSTSKAYWIIENYGANNSFDTLNTITFNNTGTWLNNCSLNKLYTRMPNADGPVWGTAIDQADNCSGNAQGNQIIFSTGNSVYQSGQYIVGAGPQVITADNWFDFTARPYQQNSVMLSWTTGKEVNVSHFIVERKNGNHNFMIIDSVKAIGNSGFSTSYQSIDKKPERGLNEYRIKIVSTNGQFIYSPVRNVLFKSLPEKIVIYPVPQKAGQDIFINSNYRNLKYELIDSFGRIVSRGVLENNSSSISTQGISKGSYNLIFDIEGVKVMEKIILN